MFQEKNIVKCPFCLKGKIEVLRVPGYRKYVKGGFKDIKDQIEVSNDCPNCGKNSSKIKKKLRSGDTSSLSDEKIIKRLKEAGFSSEFKQKF